MCAIWRADKGIERRSAGASPSRHWYYGAAGLGIATALFMAVPSQNVDGIARLERLAPRIERAHVLPPDTKDAISGLLARQRALTGSHNGAVESRRRSAIERVTSAMQAKQLAAVEAGDHPDHH